MIRPKFTGQYEPFSLHHTRVTLEVQRFAEELLISRMEVDRPEGAAFLRDWEGNLRARMCAYIMGRRRNETVSYPADWWEAAKQRWAPHWFLKRWPVRFKTWSVDAFALFPELAPARGELLELSFCMPAREVFQ